MNNCSGGQPRYKGIENFLRRLAFNLGNSPSQTDVKIISCIPIDVTDLHQKVIFLEKELQDQTRLNNSNVVNQAFVYPAAVSHNNPVQYQTCNVRQDSTPDTVPTPDSAGQMSVNVLASSTSNLTSDNQDLLAPAAAKTDHRTKKKLKKIFKTEHLVYHARTDTPLHFTANFRRATNKQSAARSSHASSQYFDKDRTSEISSPVCRDVSNHKHKYDTRDSDTCSCIHGNFANIDDHIKHYYCVDSCCGLHRAHVGLDKSTRYYDSSLYDLVPVRENIKPRKSLKEATKRINDVYNNMEILNMRHHSDQRNKIYSATCERNRLRVNKGVTVNADQILADTRELKVGPSHTCYIDCGHIYPKKSSQRGANNCSQITNMNSIQPDINENDAQRINNEKCLHEIKSILQNVLQEIKTTAKTKVEDVQHRSSADVQREGCAGPYSASPYQLATCSLSFPSAGLCPAMPYMHPVMMPPVPPGPLVPPARLCARHLRRTGITGSDEPAQSSPDKTSAGTSTRDREPPSPPAERNETDLLIREIYKCLSLESGESAGPGGGGGAAGGEVGRFVSRSGTHSGLDRISEIAEKESRPDLTSGESSSEGSEGDTLVADRKPKIKDRSSSKAKKFISKIVNFLKKKPKRGDIARHGGGEESEASSDDEYTTISSDGPGEEPPARLYNEHMERVRRRPRTVLAGPARSVYWQTVEARPVLLKDNEKMKVRLVRPPKHHISDRQLNSRVKVNKNTALTWLKKYKSGVRQCGRNWTNILLES